MKAYLFWINRQHQDNDTPDPHACMQTGEIEKVFDSEHRRGYYRVRGKGVAKLTVESMIERLGITATYYVIRKKLGKPIEVDIFEEVEQDLEAEPKNVSWEELFEYLQGSHPLIF